MASGSGSGHHGRERNDHMTVSRQILVYDDDIHIALKGSC